MKTNISRLLLGFFATATIVSAARLGRLEETGPVIWSKGCVHNGEVYKEGAVIGSQEPCLNCTCRQGAVQCHLQVCPYLHDSAPPPPGCVLVHRKGSCCPKLHCPDSDDQQRLERKDPSGKLSTWKIRSNLRRMLTKQLSRSASDKSGCVEKGTLYAEGSAMMSSTNCEYCFCLRGKQLCVKPRCAPPMAGCTATYNHGSCCPTRYDCPTNVTDNATVSKDEKPSKNVRENDRLIDLSFAGSRKEKSWKKVSQRIKREELSAEVPEAPTTDVPEAADAAGASTDADQMAGNPAPVEITSEDVTQNDSPAVITVEDLPEGKEKQSGDSIQVQVTSSVSTKQDPPKADSGRILDSLLSLKNKPAKSKTETKTSVSVSSSTSVSSSSSKSSSTSTTSSETPSTTTSKAPERLEPVAEPVAPVKIEDEDKFHLKDQNQLKLNTETEQKPAVPELQAGSFSPVGVPLDEPKSADYEDYDYRNMELPPSLPNLKIIPFVAADAVVMGAGQQNVDDDERLQLGISEQRSPVTQIESKPGEEVKSTADLTSTTTSKPAPVFSGSDKSSSSSPLLAFTVTFPPKPTPPPPVVTRRPTSTTTTSTVAPTTRRPKPQKSSSNSLGSAFSGGILRVDGCNIYGVMYSVGRIIEELSGPCIECRCTELGVQCSPLSC